MQDVPHTFKPTAAKMAKVFALVSWVAAAAYTVVPYSGAYAANTEKHDSFRIGISQYPSTLHPLFDEMVAKSLVLGATQRPITAYDAGWTLQCILCTQIPSFENGLAKKETGKDGKPGLAVTYTLKNDLFWGDGTPVTTKDVLFGWEVGKHPLSGVGNGEFFSKDIAGIDAVDDKTFVIHFSKQMCEFAVINDFYPLPAHLERTVFEKNPANYKNATLYVTDPDNAGLYDGPYKVSRIYPGSKIELARNPQWKGAQGHFSEISFSTIENASALSANLLSDGIDYIAGELGLSLDQAIALEKRLPKDKFKVVYKSGLTYEHIDLPLDQPMFADLRLRQALMYGMNREAINTQLFGGKQPVADTDVNPLDSVYNGNVQKYPYDPAKAAKLLDDAGWKIDYVKVAGKDGHDKDHGKDKDKKRLVTDGIRRNAKGEKLRLVLQTTSGNTSRETIAQALQADWKKIGIDVVIENQNARVLFGTTMRNRTFEGGVMYAWVSAPRNIPKTTLYSTMIPAPENNYAGQNYAGYNNPKMDRIIDDLETVCAPAANQKLWNELQTIYADELPALPLYYRADAFFIPAWLEGLTPTGHQNPTTLWVEDWSVAP